MVPYLIWAPYFFGPREIFDPRENIFMRGPNFWGTKFLGAQKSQGPKSPSQSAPTILILKTWVGL